MTKYDLDFTVKPDETLGLCTNHVNDNCCSCFKKQDSDTGCFKMKCYNKGLEGTCIGKNGPDPAGYIETSLRCDEKGECLCWIPCKDVWSEKKCKKFAKKGKCVDSSVADNCCATCSTILAWIVAKNADEIWNEKWHFIIDV